MAWRKCAAVALILICTSTCLAHETDQFLLPPNRRFADIGEVLTRWAFDLLQRAVEQTNADIRVALEAKDQKLLETLYSQDHMVHVVNGELPWAAEVIEGLDRTLHSDQTRARYPGLVVGHKSLGSNIYSGAGFILDPRQLIRLFYSSDFMAYGVHMGPTRSVTSPTWG